MFLQCECKAQVTLTNIREDISQVIDGTLVEFPSGIYITSVADPVHCCPFGNLGGMYTKARGPDGRPIHQ